MPIETFLSLIGFAFVTSVTPGPNNMMLFASGVNFGFRRTLPHMFGIGFGFFTLLLGVGFGLGALLAAWPSLHTALKVAGGVYLIYIAVRIGLSRSLPDSRSGARPMTFTEAAAFQWVNPKSWMMAVTSIALYSDPTNHAATVLLVGVAFALTNLPTASTWAGFGSVLRNWLSNPRRLKWFNIAMAVALVASLWPMLR